MRQATLAGEFVVSVRKAQRGGTDYSRTEEHRREQAAARAAILIADWLDGRGDRATIQAAYHELEAALS